LPRGAMQDGSDRTGDRRPAAGSPSRGAGRIHARETPQPELTN